MPQCRMETVMDQFILAPAPQLMTLFEGIYTPSAQGPIHISHPELYPLAQAFRTLFAAHALSLGDIQVDARQQHPAALQITLDPRIITRPDAFQLLIYPSRVELLAASPAAVFYALQLLKQIFRQRATLPCANIQDWADFAHRGLMLDISRDRVPTMATLEALIPQLAELRLNQLQLYMEHTFAYVGHKTVWQTASPFTGEEILALDALCRQYYIELVPNQNSFGHLHRWFKHPAYRPLAELPPESETRPFSLCPTDPAALGLLSDLYAQLLPHFTSTQFNVGCDETFDLGLGRSATACESQGKGRVYLNFLRQIHDLATPYGKTLQFWGDIILDHPELIPELPQPIIALNWGYEADHPFEAQGAQFAAAKIPHYVCPGTSSWNSLTGRTTNALGNLAAAAQAGKTHGAIGYLITDWGDNGHLQPLSISLPTIAYGACQAWCSANTSTSDLAHMLSLHLFADASGHLAEGLLALGDVYLQAHLPMANQSPLVAPLLFPGRPLAPELTPALWQAAQTAIDQALDKLNHHTSQHPEAALITQESEWIGQLLAHSCRLGAALTTSECNSAADLPRDIRQALQAELETLNAAYPSLWLARSRPGGLGDSQARIHKILALYQGVTP
jgi:hexosaminidase